MTNRKDRAQSSHTYPDYPFSTHTALEAAQEGRLEDWVHAYLVGGAWANLGLSDGLKLQVRWWRGPLLLPLASMARCLGPEPGMEYSVRADEWEQRTRDIAGSILANRHAPLDLPPLICVYDAAQAGALSVRDGNHRYGAYQRLGWPAAWTLVWYNSLQEYNDAGLPPGMLEGCA